MGAYKSVPILTCADLSRLPFISISSSMGTCSSVVQKLSSGLGFSRVLLGCVLGFLLGCSLDAKLIDVKSEVTSVHSGSVSQELTSGSQIAVTTSRNYKVDASLGRMVNQLEVVTSGNYKVIHSVQGVSAVGESQ